MVWALLEPTDVEEELEVVVLSAAEGRASGTLFPETPDGIETAVMEINSLSKRKMRE
jgi:hypothetical protein